MNYLFVFTLGALTFVIGVSMLKMRNDPKSRSFGNSVLRDYILAAPPRGKNGTMHYVKRGIVTVGFISFILAAWKLLNDPHVDIAIWTFMTLAGFASLVFAADILTRRD